MAIFKIIVGTIIQKFGYPVKESALKEAFDNIENCYLQNGWYRDSSRGRQDYYNPFAFHYYGLIYSVLEPEKPISQIYKNRAIDFSRDYIHFCGRWCKCAFWSKHDLSFCSFKLLVSYVVGRSFAF